MGSRRAREREAGRPAADRRHRHQENKPLIVVTWCGAQECAYVWWRMFNEATEGLGDAWDGHVLGASVTQGAR